MDYNHRSNMYGDIIALRMSGSQFYLGQNGMSQVELELRNFEHIGNQQAQESLFKIVPLLSSSAMIQCLKYDKAKDSNKKDELLLNLQKEITQNQRIDQMHADTYVLYNDAFNLQHIFSHKYLSIRQSPIDPNNFNLMLDVYIDEQVGFTFQQFYKKRIKKEDIIAYGDKICFTIMNMKENVDQRHCMIKKLRGDKEILQQIIPSQDIIFSEDTSKISPFEYNKIVLQDINSIHIVLCCTRYLQFIQRKKFQFYKLINSQYIRAIKYYISSPQGEEKENLRAGSICNLMHIETNSSVYENQSEETIEENDMIDEIIQNDRQGLQGESFEQSLNKSDIFQQQVKLEYKQNLQYYLTNKLNFQDSSNLWTIEKLNPFEGGSIKFKEPIRFKNISNQLNIQNIYRSREYLRIKINQKQFKLEASLLPDQINKQIQPETFDDFSCVFFLIDEKGHDKTPNTFLNCNYSFCIVHAMTGVQIGINFDHEICSYKLNLSQNLMYNQSFKLNRLSDKLCWEILFVESCKQMLEKNMIDFEGILNKGNWQINFSTQEQILSIVHTINSLNRFARSNDIFFDDIFLEKEDQENDGRLSMMIVQQIHTTLIPLIQLILKNPKNFNKIKALSHQNQDQKENKFQIVEKNSFNQSYLRASVTNNGDSEYQQKNQSNIDQATQYGTTYSIPEVLMSDLNLGLSLIVIINDSYELLSLLIKSDKFPKHLIKSFILNILYMIGIGNCWKCLSLLFRKYDLLDHLIQEQDIAEDQTKFKDVLINLNLLQAVTLQYLKNYDIEEKYSLDFIEFLINICRDMDENIKIKTQVLIGKLIFEDLDEQEVEHLFILFQTVRRDYTAEKSVLIQVGVQKMDFFKFSRLTNNQIRGREMNLFLHTIKLYSLICEDRNYFNIFNIRAKFPYYLLLSIIRNEDVNFLIRSFFLDLYSKLYLDVDPFYKFTSPKTFTFNKEYLLQQQSNIKAVIEAEKQQVHQKKSFKKSETIKSNISNNVAEFKEIEFSFEQNSRKNSILSPKNSEYRRTSALQKSTFKTVKNDNKKQTVTLENAKKNENFTTQLETNPDEVRDDTNLINPKIKNDQLKFIKINLQDKQKSSTQQKQFQSGEIELIDDDEENISEDGGNNQDFQFNRRQTLEQQKQVQQSKQFQQNSQKKIKSTTKSENEITLNNKFEKHNEEFYNINEQETRQKQQNQISKSRQRINSKNDDENACSIEGSQIKVSELPQLQQVTLISFDQNDDLHGLPRVQSKNQIKSDRKIKQKNQIKEEDEDKIDQRYQDEIDNKQFPSQISQKTDISMTNKKIVKLSQKIIESDNASNKDQDESKPYSKQNIFESQENKLGFQNYDSNKYKQKKMQEQSQKNNQRNGDEEEVDEEEDEEEYIDEIESLKKDEELMNEIEYRPEDWLKQIQVYVLEFLEKVTINKKNETENLKLSNVQLSYLYYTLKTFKLLILMKQCSLDHKIIKYLTNFFQLDHSNQKLKSENIPFLTCKLENSKNIFQLIFIKTLEKTERQKQKEIFKELDRSVLSTKIKQEIIDIYSTLVQQKMVEIFELVIGHMSMNIDTMADLDEKINISYGKQKLILDDLNEEELEVDDKMIELEESLSNIDNKNKNSVLKRVSSINSVERASLIFQNKDKQQSSKKSISQIQKGEEEPEVSQKTKKKDDKEQQQKKQNIQIIKKFNYALKKYSNNVNNYISKQFIKFIERGLFDVNQQDLGGKFVICSTTFISKILALMSTSLENNLNQKILFLVFQLTNQKQEIIRNLFSLQILFRNEEIAKFEVLQALTKVLSTFQERRFIFSVSQDIQDMEKLLNLFQVSIQKALNQLKDIYTKIESYNKEEDYFYKIQKMFLSLDFHKFIIDFLEDAHFFVLTKTHRNLIQNPLKLCFEFLRYFCMDNQENSQMMKEFLSIFQNYLTCYEVGQTQFFAEVFLDVKYKNQNIDEGILVSFLNSIRLKHDYTCQVDPQNLSTFNSLIIRQGEYREDVANKIQQEVFSSENIYKFFGMQDSFIQQDVDSEDEEEMNNLDKSQMNVLNIINSNLKYFQQQINKKLAFEIDWSLKERLPYIYQVYALRTTRNIYNTIRNKDKFNDQLKLIFCPKYIFNLLAMDDFYKEQNDENFLRLLFKVELMETIKQLWLQTLSYPQEIIRNSSVKRFLQEQIRFLKNYDIYNAQNIEKQISQIRSNHGLQTIHGSLIYNCTINYLQNINPTIKRQFLKEPFSFVSYTFKHLLPFMTQLKNVFLLLGQTEWYPDDLPKKELKLMKLFEEKFEEFYYSKLTEQQQHFVKEYYKDEIIEFSKAYNIKNVFLEKVIQEQIIEKKYEQDKYLSPFLKNLNQIKGKNLLESNAFATKSPSKLQSTQQITSEQNIQQNDVIGTMLSINNDSQLKNNSALQINGALKSNGAIQNNSGLQNNSDPQNNTHQNNSSLQNNSSHNSNKHQQLQSKNSSHISNQNNLESRLHKIDIDSVSAAQMGSNSQPLLITNLFNQRRENLIFNLNSNNIDQCTQIGTNLKRLYAYSTSLSKDVGNKLIWNINKYSDVSHSNANNQPRRKSQINSNQRVTGKNQILLEMEFTALEIGMSLPNLRNVLSMRRKEQNSQAYRKLFLQIITNEDVRKSTVLPQNEYLLNMIMNVMIKDAKKLDIANIKQPIQLKQFYDRVFSILDHTLLYPDFNIQKEQALLVENIINFVVDLLQKFQGEQKREMQNYIYFNGFQRVLKNSLTSPTTLQSVSIFTSLIHLICKLVENSNKEVRDDIYDLFTSSIFIENFMKKIYQVLCDQLAYTKYILHKRKVIFHLLNNNSQFAFQKHQITLFHHISTFIQLLNSEQHTPFQIFWRKQAYQNNSYDIMIIYIQLLDQLVQSTLLNQQNPKSIVYADFFHEQIKDSIKVLLSMVQGRLVENKDQLMKSTFLDNMAELWECSKLFPKEQSQMREKVDKKMEYFLILIGMGSNKISDNAFSEVNVNFIKQLMLEVFEHLIESDINDGRKRQIVRRLTYKNLQKYFVDLFIEFKVNYKGFYSSYSHEFLIYGFKLFLLLQNHEESIRNLHQAAIISARQILEKKNKSLIKSQQEITEEEFTCSFAEAYRFFEQNTGHIIIINEQINEVQTIYFPYYPHCNCSNDQIQSEINKKIDRFSYETKLISFMDLAEEYNQRLIVEQRFKDKSHYSRLFKVIIFIFKNIEVFRLINFFIGISMNIYLLLKYQNIDGSEYFQKLRAGNLDNFINITIVILFSFDIFILVFSILQMEEYYSWKTKKDIKNKQTRHAQTIKSQFSSHTKNQILKTTDYSTFTTSSNNFEIPLSKFQIIVVGIKNWLSNNTISYVIFYIPILLLTMLFNEFFASFLLLDVFFKFPETQNIVKVLWDMKKKIISTIILYLIIIYTFALLAFLITPLNTVYHDICENFLSCFSVILDSTLRSPISSSPIYNSIYEGKFHFSLFLHISKLIKLKQIMVVHSNQDMKIYISFFMYFLQYLSFGYGHLQV